MGVGGGNIQGKWIKNHLPITLTILETFLGEA